MRLRAAGDFVRIIFVIRCGNGTRHVGGQHNVELVLPETTATSSFLQEMASQIKTVGVCVQLRSMCDE